VSGRHTAELTTKRLVLTPLREDDAAEMVGVLSDAALYTFIGGSPPGVDELRTRYRRQVKGPRRTGEIWHNWIIRLNGSGAIGFVQATVQDESADVAWMIAPAWQRKGYATEAAGAMCEWLRAAGIETITAHIHPDHLASNKVALAIGLESTGQIDDEGEMIWSST
jgi:RimJ/RimL family protein N-acetyltransferase